MGLSLGGRVSVFVSDNTPGNSVNCCTSTQWLRMSVFEWKHALCVNIAYVNLVRTSWMYKGEPLIAIPSLILTSCILDWTGSECWVWGKQNRDGVSWALSTQLRPFWRGALRKLCVKRIWWLLCFTCWMRGNQQAFSSLLHHCWTHAKPNWAGFLPGPLHLSNLTLTNTHTCLRRLLMLFQLCLLFISPQDTFTFYFGMLERFPVRHPKTWERICIF